MRLRIGVFALAAVATYLVAVPVTVGQSDIVDSPFDALPPYITRLTHFGQRADWSHDGKHILFVEKTFGDVYEIELGTEAIRPMTHHYFHEGYTRALYLLNGDILLSGARTFDATDPWSSRSEANAELWVLKKDLSGPPMPLGEKCSEGPAVSRQHMKIAWTHRGTIYTAEISYDTGVPVLVNKKQVLKKEELPFECSLETQNFRPPDETELIFSAYNYQGTEVMGLDLETGKVTNYSNAPKQYDEPEGIFPDGNHTLVECDRHSLKGSQYIDIYKLALDGSGETKRLTFFSRYPGYKASNPVVSDDGRYIAFQGAKTGDPAGVGRGILVLDTRMHEQSSSLGTKIDAEVEELHARYGVRVHYIYDAEVFYPAQWRMPPIDAGGSQMPFNEVARLLEITRKFLARYPAAVLEKNLSDVFFVKGLEFYGKAFGGSYINTGLYIDNQGEDKGYTEEFLHSIMHSEFSSILFRNYRKEFPEKQWKAMNPQDFAYGGTGVEMLGEPDIFSQTEELLEWGFLVKYCMSSMENDMNMYAFYAFTQADQLQKTALEYERIGAKYGLFLDFYDAIDPEIFKPKEPSALQKLLAPIESSEESSQPKRD